MAESWHKNGAQVIGGCCRIGPEIIREVRARVFDKRRNGSGLGS
jgi:S-methylmethionine-dependent homocysteine/selenocysteine methylase